jgi:hypothetical protein
MWTSHDLIVVAHAAVVALILCVVAPSQATCAPRKHDLRRGRASAPRVDRAAGRQLDEAAS